MAHKDLGRVLGLSTFEEWLNRNPNGTWEEFLEDIKGPQGPEGLPGQQGVPGNVNFATFEIIDGYLWATYTRDTEHMEFSINENGELEVTINEQN